MSIAREIEAIKVSMLFQTTACYEVKENKGRDFRNQKLTQRHGEKRGQ
jgi:hypothetical protein